MIGFGALAALIALLGAVGPAQGPGTDQPVAGPRRPGAAAAAAGRQLRRLDLHRDGPPAVDRLRRDAHPRRRLPQRVDRPRWSPRSRPSPCSTALLAVVEVRLLLRYARAGLPEPAHPAAPGPPDRRRGPPARVRLLRSPSWSCTTVWFLLIAVLLTGYFVLEGFDFGVGMLLPVLGRDEPERRVMINTIGPVWDGNEVWLITAGGAMFAAFPEWYATLFSGFYLPLLLILLALIVRGVAFEYRGNAPAAVLEGPLGPRDHRRLGGARVAVGCRVRQHRARGAAGRRPRVRRQPDDAAQPVRPAGWSHARRRVPRARRGVRRAEDHRRDPRPGQPARRPRRARAPRCWPSRSSRGRCSASAAPRPRSGWRWSAAVALVLGLADEPGAPGGLGVRRHRGGDRAGRGDAVRRALPRRAALDDRPGGHA